MLSDPPLEIALSTRRRAFTWIGASSASTATISASLNSPLSPSVQSKSISPLSSSPTASQTVSSAPPSHPRNCERTLVNFNRKLRTFGEVEPQLGRDLPLFVGRCELDAGSGATEVVDEFVTFDFCVPGILKLMSGMFPAGTAEESGFGRPDFGKSLAGHNASCQAVTPVCEGKARYFFGEGTSRDHGDEARCDLVMSMVMQAFVEDRAMIEAQYKSI